MEPFVVRCETCQAQLRVNDEQFLGQIHPCPKCSSMVHIALPASMAEAMAEATADAGQCSAVGQATAGLGLTAKLAEFVGRHAIVSSLCGAALVVTGSVAVALVMQHDDEVAARAEPSSSAIESTSPAGADSGDVTNGERTVSGDTALFAARPKAATKTEETSFSADVSQEDAENAEKKLDRQTLRPLRPPVKKSLLGTTNLIVSNTESEPDAATAVGDQSAGSMLSSQEETNSADDRESVRTRTLRLDPLRFDPAFARSASPSLPPQSETAEAKPDYPSLNDDDASAVAAKPQADVRDVATRLALRIESIDVPARPLAECLEMLSRMAAVPIRLDPAAGVSPQTMVTIRGQDTTLAALLDDVLAEHGLARIERDGRLVVVRSSDP